MIVDAHLDLGWTALHSGRDLTRPAERGSGALTSLPELGAAGVALVGATLFAEPADAWLERYRGLWDQRFDQLNDLVIELVKKEKADARRKKK